MSKYTQSVKEIVNDITVLLIFPVVLFLLMSIFSIVVWFLMVFNFGLSETLMTLGGLNLLMLIPLPMLVFSFILIRDFRRMKKWTYRVVEFCCDWGNWMALAGMGNKLRREDVRRAFGIEDEDDPE